jgi:hypothetical protein
LLLFSLPGGDRIHRTAFNVPGKICAITSAEAKTRFSMSRLSSTGTKCLHLIPAKDSNGNDLFSQSERHRLLNRLEALQNLAYLSPSASFDTEEAGFDADPESRPVCCSRRCYPWGYHCLEPTAIQETGCSSLNSRRIFSIQSRYSLTRSGLLASRRIHPEPQCEAVALLCGYSSQVRCLDPVVSGAMSHTLHWRGNQVTVFPSSKRILVVALDSHLRHSRRLLLESKGYRVDSVAPTMTRWHC